MNVVFRADSSIDIGIGHVMRCLTLADGLSERGATCQFVCREHPGNLIELVRDRGYTIFVLPVSDSRYYSDRSADEVALAHAEWLGADWESDAKLTKRHIDVLNPVWVVVDHYALDARWENDLRSVCKNVMVIDDLGDRPHDCDLLLDQNLGRTKDDYAFRVSNKTTVVVGPKYALLREQFQALRTYSLTRRSTPRLKHLLVTMGGIDKDNATGNVLAALRECVLPDDLEITVVMGLHAPHLTEVRSLAANLPWTTTVRVNVQDMAQLMANSDLAISAAGSTSWERCVLGLPSIIVVLADNQKFIAGSLEKAGASKVISLVNLKTDLKAFFENSSSLTGELEQIALRAANVTDGNGVKRIVDLIFASKESVHENIVHL